MKSKNLLIILQNSTLRFDPDLEKRELYEQYYPRLKDILTFCPSNINLSKLSSFNELKSQNDFEIYIKENDSKSIQSKFETMLSELRTLSQLTEVGDEWINTHRHNNFVGSIIFIVSLAIFSAMVIIFAFLDVFEVFGKGGLASGICGICDFLFGVSFFIYEYVSDHKEKIMYEDMSKATGMTFVDKSKKVWKSNDIYKNNVLGPGAIASFGGDVNIRSEKKHNANETFDEGLKLERSPYAESFINKYGKK